MVCRYQFGGGFGTSNNATTTDDLAQFFPGTTVSGSTAGAGVAGLNQSGPIGGVQFGYNFQLNPLFVFGFEADIQGAAIDGRGENSGTSTESFAGTSSFFKSVTTASSAEALAASFTNAAITTSGSGLVTADLNWLGTARLRAGYLVTPNLLLYATGGLAYGGVSASDSTTLNFGNLTADSFALGFGQAIGSGATATASASSSPTSASAAGAAHTTATGAAASASASGGGTATATAASSSAGQTSFGFATATTKPLSVALATTTQSFAHVSDTKFGGTVGGGIEWMMAPNWSVKAEALYYDLGSVTVTTPLTSSINPFTAALGPLGDRTLPSSGTLGGAINKFTSATVSNSTRVSFQGVIIRLGLNYHFNLL